MRAEIVLPDKSRLRETAKALLEAAHDHWRAMQKEAGGAAVIWVTDDDGRMVVFTRGEYAGVIREALRQRDPGAPWLEPIDLDDESEETT